MPTERLTLEEDVSISLIIGCGEHGLIDAVRTNIEALCAGTNGFEETIKAQLLSITDKIGKNAAANHLLARAMFVLSRTRRETANLIKNLPATEHTRFVSLIAHNNLGKSKNLQWPSIEFHQHPVEKQAPPATLSANDSYGSPMLAHTIPLKS